MSRSRKSAKSAGARFERVVADSLKKHVSEWIDRKVSTGARDTGDIANVRSAHNLPVVVECKDFGGVFHVGTWLKEAEEERINDGAAAGIVIAKRRGHADPLDQVVMMPVRDLIVLLTGQDPTNYSEKVEGQA